MNESERDRASRVLGVFAKQPLAGQVKTRLASQTSPEFAAQVAEAFLCDTLARLATIPASRILAFAPPEAELSFRGFTGGAFALVRQVSGDLGQRMSAFFQAQLTAGAEAVVLLGTDSPTVPLEFITQAFAELASADIVLGPATDGGYYLIGIARRMPPIFSGVRWSSMHVLSDTMAKLPPDWRLALLPPWYDVDTLADWEMLRGHLAAMRRAGIDAGLPHTLRLIDSEHSPS